MTEPIPDADGLFRFEAYYGTMRLQPIVYTVTETIVKGWLWDTTEYWIECEFSRLGPLSRRDLADMLPIFATYGRLAPLPASLLKGQ